MTKYLTIISCFLLASVIIMAPSALLASVVEYDLVIERQKVEIQGVAAAAMTINGKIPGPVLRFTEGDIARIHVRNTMDVATSIHWHGLFVPPGMDGVPLISFPPIAPGEIFTYEFPIRQRGTYWYHSHSGLQEQRGMYGAIVILPDGKAVPEKEYVVLFSDWIGEHPDEVIRTLKRGSEWYALQKGSAQSIIGAARTGNLGAYYKRELLRMPPMDIADVAYDHFLANGAPEIKLEATAGARVRLRLVNGSATTYFHLEFSGGPMTIVAADGQDVEPVEVERLLIAVAETYDVVVTIPEAGAYELRAAAHDGSGFASVWLGEGFQSYVERAPYPDLYHFMGQLSASRVFALTPAGSMGMDDRDVKAGKFDNPGMMAMGGMADAATLMNMEEMDHGEGMGHGGGKDTMEGMKHGKTPSGGHEMAMEQGKMASNGHEMPMEAGKMTSGGHEMPMEHGKMASDSHKMGMDHGAMPMGREAMKQRQGHGSGEGHSCPACFERGGKGFGSVFRPLAADISSRGPLVMDGMDPRRPWPPYDKLRAKIPTAFPADKPVREVRFTLDGDMERYVWLLNNRPLSESDVIPIKEGEVVRFILINRTMMHHPMHLHGHFFRVVNGQGDYSPLKHTVDVAPMSTTVIEFYAGDAGDWFFHCHLLYHMKAGMARVVHYEGFDPGEEVNEVRGKLYKDSWYVWADAEFLTNMTEGYLQASNTRNILTAEWEIGWGEIDDTEWEAIVTWERYFNRFFTVFIGGDFEGVNSDSGKERAVLGLTYLLPLNLESRLWVDSDAAVRVQLEKHFELTPRIMLGGEVEYDTEEKWEGSVALSYLLHKSISLSGKWHSEFGWGAGVSVRL